MQYKLASYMGFSGVLKFIPCDVLVKTMLISLSFILIVGGANSYAANKVLIQDFEKNKAFKGKLKGVSRVKHGKEAFYGSKYAGLWDSKRYNGVTVFPPVKDWLAYRSIQFSIHSSEANSQPIALVIYSQNPATDGEDIYQYHMKVTWEGWKTFRVPFNKLKVKGVPIGLDKIGELKIRTYRFSKAVGLPQKFMVDDIILYK